jgi:iron(III) transport system ATP-binding protein
MKNINLFNTLKDAHQIPEKEVRSISAKGVYVQVRGVSMSYGNVPGVEALYLNVRKGETLALFGPSGCGKTTTLRLLAGLERPDCGEIYLADNCASNSEMVLPPHKRELSMVFQDLALWPHMTAAQHVEFALPEKYRTKTERYRARLKILKMVRMEKSERYPAQLSGGEQQRLALARALAAEPQMLLLDEPFSSLDPLLKKDLLQELRAMTDSLSITVIFVTHQSDEAKQFADTVAIMKKGTIVVTKPVSELKDEHREKEGADKLKKYGPENVKQDSVKVKDSKIILLTQK